MDLTTEQKWKEMPGFPVIVPVVDSRFYPPSTKDFLGALICCSVPGKAASDWIGAEKGAHHIGKTCKQQGGDKQCQGFN